MYRGAGSLSAIRRRSETNARRPAFPNCTPRTRVQEEGRCKSQSERSQTKDQPLGLGPRFPRHGLVDRFRFIQLAGEFGIGQPFAYDLANANVKALRISHLPIVEAECLFVDVAEQVERFHADVGAVQLPLNKRPEVFHAIGMHVAIGLLNRMINDRVLVVLVQSVVGQQFIGEDRRASFHVLANLIGFQIYVNSRYASHGHFLRVQACQEQSLYPYLQCR
jgi:hypothetical protein